MLHANYARLLSCAALCALFTACGDDGTAPVDSTCEPGEVCTCASNDDCPTGQVCLFAQGVCIPGSTADVDGGDASDEEVSDAGSDADTSTTPDASDTGVDSETSTPDADVVNDTTDAQTDPDVAPDVAPDVETDTTDADSSGDTGPVLPADDYNPWVVYLTEISAIEPRIDLVLADGSERRRLNFNTDALIESPSWSSDGTRLAWAGAGGSEAFVSVRILDVATGDIDSYNGSPAIALIDGLTWSPDGDRIAVTGRPLSGDASTLWVLDISAGTFEEIVDDKRANFPVWSPNGDVIFFSGTEGFDSDVFEIWAATPDGSTVTAVTSGSDIIGSFDVAWDANRFAFSRTSGDETIYLWDRSRDRYTSIGQSQDGDPDFFGHGNALAIGRIAVSGSPDIVSIATDGALLETLTNDPPASAQPNVSPIDASEIDVTGISAVTTP